MAALPEHEELRTLVQETVRETGVASACAGVLIGDDIVTAAAGVANRDTGLEATTDTLFQIGSVTKVYTATLVLQLADDGLLDLDEPAATYLPGTVVGNYEEARGITVRQLLCHTSGMAGDHFADFGRGDDAIERYVGALADQPRVHAPGEIMSYCNAGYIVLGRIVEVLREMPWHAAAKTHLTDQLGLTDTVHLPEEAILRRVAVGHMPRPDDPSGPSTVAPVWTLTPAMAPAGALTVATAGDLLAFARLHLEDGRSPHGTQVLSAASAKAMQTPQVEFPSRAIPGATAWGLGWILFDWDGTRVVGHDGATLGQLCSLRLVPDEHAAVAIQVNDVKAGKEAIDTLARRIFADVFGTSLPDEPTPLEDATDLDLSPYEGSYAQENYVLDVRRTGDGLEADLVPTTDHAKQMMAPKHGLALRPAGGQDFILEDDDGPTPVTFAGFQENGRPKFLHLGARALVRT